MSLKEPTLEMLVESFQEKMLLRAKQGWMTRKEVAESVSTYRKRVATLISERDAKAFPRYEYAFRLQTIEKECASGKPFCSPNTKQTKAKKKPSFFERLLGKK